ncbi:MAG: hypothetical protein NUV91_06975 [Candidatus Omnitrophica bacterium]|nr:hypothetical protein [Candidatus Omnitrophota bacterium]
MPTLLLLIGYPIFWLELYGIGNTPGNTTPLAWLIFIFLAGMILREQRLSLILGLQTLSHEWSKLNQSQKIYFLIGGSISLFILGCALWASLLPPHLSQESDVLVYHLTIPRQHLILGSFQHIPWSTTDLFYLPVDFALTPYWLATTLPNKWPQFLFFLGLLAIATRLVGKFSQEDFTSKIWIIYAILGSHNVGIQAGTAMLDITICYLFFAALDSFLSRMYGLAALELAFCMWSKPFIPLQFAATLLVMIVLYFVLKSAGFKNAIWDFHSSNKIINPSIGTKIRKISIYFFLLSLVIGGPFVLKSLYYTGSPLFPLMTGKFMINPSIDQNSLAWHSINDRAQQLLAIKDAYGSGRSFKDFIEHFWFIAVPENGVNNRYDYPVGLIYLLCLGPFIYKFANTLRRKEFALLPWFIVVSWGLWWMGSQQTRFLFIPIILMFMMVFSLQEFRSRTLLLIIILSLMLTSLSVFRAHKTDFGKWGYDAVRAQDKTLLEMGKKKTDQEIVSLNVIEAAYANFPVKIVSPKSVSVLSY